MIDESVAEWLAELRRVSDQFENFVDYAVERGATEVWGGRDMTADFPNGWSASATLIRSENGSACVKHASWCNGGAFNGTYEGVKNDWRAAVDRAVSGGAS